MNGYRYQLDKSSRKFICPRCEKKRFVRFINIETGDYMPDQFGRCDREAECGHFEQPGSDDNLRVKMPEKTLSTPPAYIPFDVLKLTLKGYDQNIFIQNLLENVPFPFEPETLNKVISMYYLGTVLNGYMTGAVTIPFIDVNGNVRAIQVKKFDHRNHTTGTTFLHSIIETFHKKRNEPLPGWLIQYLNNESKVSCLFGSHLLSKYPSSPIALVEAPKSAIYGTLYFGTPEKPGNYLWLAVYNLSSLNVNRCKILTGRDVTLFPDLSTDGSAFNQWSQKAKELNLQIPGACFTVSDLLEKNATEEQRKQGADIADFLINFDWRKFVKTQPEQKPESVPESLPKHELTTDFDFLIEPQTNYTEAQICEAIQKIQPRGDPRETLLKLIKSNDLTQCQRTKRIFLYNSTPF
jgi:hypothetical protein